MKILFKSFVFQQYIEQYEEKLRNIEIENKKLKVILYY